MFKPTRNLLLAVVTVLMTSSIASAAIFETQHLLPEANASATSLYASGGRMQSQYQPGSLDHGVDLQFPLAKAGFTRQEDLLWMAIGNATPFSLQPLPSNADPALYLAEAEHFRSRNADHDSAVSAPSEGTAPKAWAVILIGAGLAWSQLRRRSRHGAIHFTTR